MVDAEQVVEDVGVAPVVLLHLAQFTRLAVDDRLDAPGDVDEGALRGVTHRLFVVDDVQHRVDEGALGVGQVAVHLVRVDDVTEHLFGRIAHAQPVDGGRQQFLADPHGLVVVGGDAPFQVGEAAFVHRALGTQVARPAGELDTQGGDHDGGDGTAPDDWYPRGRGDQCRRGGGGAAHQEHGQEHGANDGGFSVDRR